MKLLTIIPAAIIVMITSIPVHAQEVAAGVSTSATLARHARFEIALSATAGYGTYFSVKQAADDKVLHGVWINIGTDLTWGDDSRRLGLRVHGMLAPTLSRDGMHPESRDYYRTGGVYAGFLARFGGFWLSPGIGVQFMTEMDYLHGNDEHEDEGTGITPEFNLGLGYTFDLSRHMALKIAMESGTSAGLLWRFQLSSGVEVRF